MQRQCVPGNFKTPNQFHIFFYLPQIIINFLVEIGFFNLFHYWSFHNNCVSCENNWRSGNFKTGFEGISGLKTGNDRNEMRNHPKVILRESVEKRNEKSDFCELCDFGWEVIFRVK